MSISVPLLQLEGLNIDSQTAQALGNWHYIEVPKGI